MPSEGPSSIRWCFTLNNPREQLLPHLESQLKLIRYSVFQKESGAEGTPHYQGYVEWTRHRQLGFCKKIIPGAHWEMAQGKREQNYAYCTKEDTRIEGPWEIGDTRPLHPGKKLKMREAVQAVVDSKPMKLIAKEYPDEYSVRYRGLEALASKLADPRDFKTEVRVFYGPPGTGKTYTAMQYGKSEGTVYRFRISPTGYWFDGYDKHTTTVFDDYSGSLLPHKLLLDLCDEYQLTVDTKGGYVEFVSKYIFITSNFMPHTWYDPKFPFAAFARRVNSWWYFQDPDREYPPEVFDNYVDFQKYVEETEQH